MTKKAKLDPELEELGEDINWKTLADPKSYYPTRLEYFAGKALQGLVTGKSDKDLLKGYFLAEKAVKLALELEALIDKTQD